MVKAVNLVFRNIFLVVLLFLFFFSFIDAVEIEMKDSFYGEETLIAKVSGVFLDEINYGDISFYRRHIEIPMIYDVVKINEDFYFYAFLPKIEDNYSVKISGIEYMRGSVVVNDDIVKNFSIGGQMADFSVNPGVVVSDKDFFLEVQNLQETSIIFNVSVFDEEKEVIDIEENTSEEENSFFDFFTESGESGEKESNESIQTFVLKSGEIEKIFFNFDSLFNSGMKYIELKSDNMITMVPVYWIVDTKYVETGCYDFLRIKPFELEENFVIGKNFSRILYIYNNGDDDVFNVSIDFSKGLKKYVNSSLYFIEEIKNNSNVSFELSFYSDEVILLNGDIEISGDGCDYDEIDVLLNFVEQLEVNGSVGNLSDFENKSILDNQTKKVYSETCAQMGGVMCSEKEKCDEDPVYAKDGVCCLGTCVSKNESTTGKLVGWVIIILILAFLIWFLKSKYKGTNKKVDLFKIAKGKK